jgi:hypothetical protein
VRRTLTGVYVAGRDRELTDANEHDARSLPGKLPRFIHQVVDAALTKRRGKATDLRRSTTHIRADQWYRPLKGFRNAFQGSRDIIDLFGRLTLLFLCELTSLLFSRRGETECLLLRGLSHF